MQGNTSVQTNAVDNNPGILSQNDRKVMLFQHEDGNISLHVFIGATGVNRVNVSTDSIQMEQGTRQGDMRPGQDVYTAEKGFFAAKETTTRDGIRKLAVGERQGGFNKQGSTVISYYMPTDFAILPEISAFAQVGNYAGNTHRINSEGKPEIVRMRKEAEILCKMGDPLLVKTEIAMVQHLERLFPEKFSATNSPANGFNIVRDFANATFVPKENEHNIHNLLRRVSNPNARLSHDESLLRARLQVMLTQRLGIIKQSQRQQTTRG